MPMWRGLTTDPRSAKLPLGQNTVSYLPGRPGPRPRACPCPRLSGPFLCAPIHICALEPVPSYSPHRA